MLVAPGGEVPPVGGIGAAGGLRFRGGDVLAGRPGRVPQGLGEGQARGVQAPDRQGITHGKDSRWIVTLIF